MKLSDAILKGAQQRPQCFGNLFGTVAPNVLGSCVLGAAWEGVYGAPPTNPDDTLKCSEELFAAFPVLDRRLDSQFPDRTLANDLTLRNDRQGQTREVIAAWLAEQGL